jgi:arylsulfatase A-like enzyme
LFKKNSVPEPYAYIENSPDPFGNNEDGSFIGLRTSKFKFIRSRKKSEKMIFLYDLKNDPKEKTNIADRNPDIVQQMEILLIEYRQNDKTSSNEYDDDDVTKIKDELKKMGYI